MGTGVLKDTFKLGALSQVIQQVSDKARNTVETWAPDQKLLDIN